MVKKKVTLSIDSEVYNSFRDYCDENGLVLSKKVDLFMSSELENSEEVKDEITE